MNTRQVQQRLKELGYNPGPIDGINGPKTKAAVREFQRDAGIAVDGIVGPQTRGAFDAAGSGGDSKKKSSGGDKTEAAIEKAIKEDYPAMAWALDHPELGDILRRAGEGEWTALKLQGELQGTDWWKQHTRGQRELEILKETDPKSYEQEVTAATSRVTSMSEDMGIPVTAAQARNIGLQLLTDDLDERQIQMAIIGDTNLSTSQIAQRAAKGQLGGGVSEAARSVDSVLNDHLMSLPPGEKGRWIRDIVTGKRTVASFEQFAQKSALAQMPWLDRFIDQGIPPAQGLAPYRQTFARVLEMNPNEVDFQDPKFQNTLRVQGDKGERLATTQELSANIRKDFADQWEQTSGAKQSAAQMTSKLAQMFGKRD